MGTYDTEGEALKAASPYVGRKVYYRGNLYATNVGVQAEGSYLQKIKLNSEYGRTVYEVVCTQCRQEHVYLTTTSWKEATKLSKRTPCTMVRSKAVNPVSWEDVAMPWVVFLASTGNEEARFPTQLDAQRYTYQPGNHPNQWFILDIRTV